ncbi:MAG: hypothetical protein ABIJ46_04820 [bacterium]
MDDDGDIIYGYIPHITIGLCFIAALSSTIIGIEKGNIRESVEESANVVLKAMLFLAFISPSSIVLSVAYVCVRMIAAAVTAVIFALLAKGLKMAVTRLVASVIRQCQRGAPPQPPPT